MDANAMYTRQAAAFQNEMRQTCAAQRIDREFARHARRGKITIDTLHPVLIDGLGVQVAAQLGDPLRIEARQG